LACWLVSEFCVVRADDATTQEFSRQVTTDEGKAFADRMGTLFIGMSRRCSVL
jgi:hypothetical protein